MSADEKSITRRQALKRFAKVGLASVVAGAGAVAGLTACSRNYSDTIRNYYVVYTNYYVVYTNYWH